MTEIEQLRKELNEMRERVAVLEKTSQKVYQQGAPSPGIKPFVWPSQSDINRNRELQDWIAKKPAPDLKQWLSPTYFEGPYPKDACISDIKG